MAVLIAKLASNEILLATYNMCYSMWRLGAIVRPAKQKEEIRYKLLCILYKCIINK